MPKHTRHYRFGSLVCNPPLPSQLSSAQPSRPQTHSTWFRKYKIERYPLPNCQTDFVPFTFFPFRYFFLCCYSILQNIIPFPRGDRISLFCPVRSEVGIPLLLSVFGLNWSNQRKHKSGHPNKITSNMREHQPSQLCSFLKITHIRYYKPCSCGGNK